MNNEAAGNFDLNPSFPPPDATGVTGKELRRLSGFDLDRMLSSPTQTAHWTPDQKKRASDRAQFLRDRFYGEPGEPVGGICCSHAWADDCFRDKAAYPPKADHVPMKACPGCGRLVPIIDFEGEACSDCRDVAGHQQYGPSISGSAISSVREMRVRLPEAELEPEDLSSLQREIRLAEEGKFIPSQGSGNRGPGLQIEALRAAA